MSTPLREQYLGIKRRYPDLLVLFQIGDFYEAFDDDARVLARELDLALTRKWFGKEDVRPLAGVPVRALDAHLAKLIRRGHRVVVCDQVTPPGKGLVEREVVRIVTPGTVIEPGLLDGRANNYLACLVGSGAAAGLAYADVSTGEFLVTEVPWARAQEELERLAPAEVLVLRGAPLPGRSRPVEASEPPPSEAAEARPAYGKGRAVETPEPGPAGQAPQTAERPGALLAQTALTAIAPELAELAAAQKALLGHFHAATLQAYGLEGSPLCTRAAGALIAHLAQGQPDALANLLQLRAYRCDRFMQLDAQTLSNLEVFRAFDIDGGSRAGSLVALLDHCATPIGGRLLRRWLRHPLLDPGELRGRQDAIDWFYRRAALRQTLTGALREVLDIERLVGRVRRRLALPQEVVALAHSLRGAARLGGLLREAAQGGASDVPAPCAPLLSVSQEALAALAAHIERALAERPASEGRAGAELTLGGFIRPGYSAELDELRAALQGGRRFLTELEVRERQRTGIRSLKVGHNKVFGYYIEVTKPNLHLVPAEYLRKQTLASGERFYTLELKEHELLVANARARLQELEQSLFRQLCEEVGRHQAALAAVAAAVGHLDLLVSLAEQAAARGYTRPELTAGDELHIVRGRHPMLEQTLGAGAFVPNDCELGGRGTRLLLLTAPNMAGKSVYLRQVALLCLLAQTGSFVPAEVARLGVVDRIFTRIGLNDYTVRGQSSFMSEMVETALILNQATPRSLIILDEVGRGTAVGDGQALAQAILEHIHNHPRLQARTLFATHYHALARCAEYLPRLANFRVLVEEDGERLRYLHRVVPGVAARSFGLHVARLAGIPAPVLRRARALLLASEEAGEERTGERRAEAPSRAGDEDLRAALLALDLDVLSPIEALNTLLELQRRARA